MCTTLITSGVPKSCCGDHAREGPFWIPGSGVAYICSQLHRFPNSDFPYIGDPIRRSKKSGPESAAVGPTIRTTAKERCSQALAHVCAIPTELMDADLRCPKAGTDGPFYPCGSNA